MAGSLQKELERVSDYNGPFRRYSFEVDHTNIQTGETKTRIVTIIDVNTPIVSPNAPLLAAKPDNR